MELGTEAGLLTPEQFGERIGAGRTYVYGELKANRIKSVKVGRLRRIPVSEVQRYVDRLLAEQATA